MSMGSNIMRHNFESEMSSLTESSINVEHKFSGVRRVIQKLEYSKSVMIAGQTPAYISEWEKLQEEYADIFLDTQLKANKLQTMIDVLIDKMWKHEKEPQIISNYLPSYIKDLEAFEIGDESAVTSRYLTLEREVESFRQGIQTSINGSATTTDSSLTPLAGIENKLQDLKIELNRTSKTLGLVDDHPAPGSSIYPPDSGSEGLISTFSNIHRALLEAARGLQNVLENLNIESASPSEIQQSEVSISEFIRDCSILSAALEKFATATAKSRHSYSNGSLITPRRSGWSFTR